MIRMSRPIAAALALTLSATLVGCSQLGEKINDEKPVQNGHIEVTETPKPTFSPQQVSMKTGQTPGDEVKDDGLNVEWKLLSADSGPNGGTVFKVRLKNLNEDVAVPPNEVNKVKLSIPGNDNVPRMQTESDGLDLPLGALSTTTVNYSFNTSLWNLSNAKLQLGNVEFDGNVNI